MAATNPARVGRIAGRQRGLRSGERADLVLFHIEDGNVRVSATYLGAAKYLRRADDRFCRLPARTLPGLGRRLKTIRLPYTESYESLRSLSSFLFLGSGGNSRYDT